MVKRKNKFDIKLEAQGKLFNPFMDQMINKELKLYACLQTALMKLMPE